MYDDLSRTTGVESFPFTFVWRAVAYARHNAKRRRGKYYIAACRASETLHRGHGDRARDSIGTVVRKRTWCVARGMPDLAGPWRKGLPRPPPLSPSFPRRPFPLLLAEYRPFFTIPAYPRLQGSSTHHQCLSGDTEARTTSETARRSPGLQARRRTRTTRLHGDRYGMPVGS